MFKRSAAVSFGISFAREVGVVAAAAAVIVLTFRAVDHFHSASPPPHASGSMVGALVTVGSHVGLRGVAFSQSPVSLLVVAAPGCPFCRQSETFHRRLLAATARKHVPFYLVVPDQHEAAEYIRDAGLSSARVREWRDLAGRVAGTPTVMALDSSGTARRVWTGRLPAEVEADVLEVAGNPSSLDLLSSKGRGTSDQGKQSSDGRVQVIEVRERGDPLKRPGNIIIPFIELSTRAPFELDRTSLQVIDCSDIPERECDAAVGLLTNLGFRTTAVGVGSLYQSCEASAVTTVR